jgi:F-type H+-transporting ATPase subunit delta
MFAQQVGKRYSRAVFELAKEKNLLDVAWDQFNSIGKYLKEDDTLIDFMTAPQVTDANKLALIKTAFESHLEKPFFDFLLVLVKKRRIQYLPEIIESLDDLIREEKKLAKATCITATKITDEERRKLIERLEQKTSLKIELKEKIDKNMIGGMVVILHNQIIDGSVLYSLSQLKNRLMKVKVH